MNIRDELLNLYRGGHAALLGQLDEVDKNRKIYPLWTIREIVAHLAGWDDAVIGFLEAVQKGQTPPTPAMRGINVYNEETVSTREGLSYDHIVREYKDTRAKLIGLLEASSEELLQKTSTLPWGGEGSFEDIKRAFGEHEMEHVADIRKIIQEAK